MRTRRPIYRLVGSVMLLFAVLAATAWAATAETGQNVTTLSVMNMTPYRVEVFVEGSIMCYRLELEGYEIGTPVLVEHEGAVIIDGVARDNLGGTAGYWLRKEYRPPLGTSEFMVNLTEAEMTPPVTIP